LIDFAHGKMWAYVPGGFEFVAAADIVEGHVLAMRRGRSGERYIIRTQHRAIEEMLALFADVTGRKPPRFRLPSALMMPLAEVSSSVLTRFFPHVPQRFTPGAIQILRSRRHADCSKARQELGYKPTSIAAAVRQAYECFVRRGVIQPQAVKVTFVPAPQTET
jgi:nucleoside-diphosphate-sugar epimerase